MKEQLAPMLAQISNYWGLIASALAVMIGGMIAIFLLYRVVHSLIKPNGSYARLVKVAFGAIYVMILVVTVLIAAERIGLPVHGLAGPAILVVLVAAVIVFFLLPFLPRLPFVPGDMVQIKDVMGTVEAITASQIVMRTFDGQTVFIPTPIAMASAIRNFSAIPNRRIEMNVDIYASNDIEQARALLMGVMTGDERVHEDPAPAVFVTAVDGEKASLVAYCWVANADWFGTRDALWVTLSNAFAGTDKVHMALPQLDISKH